MCGLGISGVASAWSAYTFEIIGVPTATALGVAAALLSIRLGQRLWDRAQVRFWREWERLTTMLEDELNVSRRTRTRLTLQSQMDITKKSSITGKPFAVANAMEGLARARSERLNSFREVLDALRSRIKVAVQG